MNLIKFEVIVLVKQCQKVSEVARLLGLKQPTVTFHMKSLEREYRAPLFQYRSGSVILTEAGEALCHYAERIIALAAEARKVDEAFVSLQRGSLRVGCSYVPAASMLPKALQRFKHDHPELNLSLTVKPAPLILELLAGQRLDLGVISALQPAAAGFVQREIGRDELVAVFPAGSPWSGLERIGFEHLGREEFIAHNPESTTRRLVDEWLKRHGVELKMKLEVDTLEVIKKILISGWGFSILSRNAVLEEVEAGKLDWRPLPGEPLARGIWLVYHEERWVSPAMAQFMRQLTASQRGI